MEQAKENGPVGPATDGTSGLERPGYSEKTVESSRRRLVARPNIDSA